MPTKLPPHGTRQRYRIEIKPGPDGARGTPCDRCKAANTQASRDQRANRKAAAARAKFTVIDGESNAADVDASTDASTPDKPPAEPGVMETAVRHDIDDIDAGLRVPFHRTLAALAIATAQEIDDPATSATARNAARKQLFEVLRSLRTQKEGDDNDAVSVALEAIGFGVPLVP